MPVCPEPVLVNCSFSIFHMRLCDSRASRLCLFIRDICSTNASITMHGAHSCTYTANGTQSSPPCCQCGAGLANESACHWDDHVRQRFRSLIILPRQARDKHMESTQKRYPRVFLAAPVEQGLGRVRRNAILSQL
jgi:hypothetical protein